MIDTVVPCCFEECILYGKPTSTLSPTSSMTTKQLLFIFDLQRAGAVAHSLYCVEDVGIDHFTAMERDEAKGICLMAKFDPLL